MTTRYRLVDKEDGEKIRIDIEYGSCGCNVPGCVDDKIFIYEGDNTVPYIISMPRLITPILEGILQNDYAISMGVK